MIIPMHLERYKNLVSGREIKEGRTYAVTKYGSKKNPLVIQVIRIISFQTLGHAKEVKAIVNGEEREVFYNSTLLRWTPIEQAGILEL